MAAGTLPEPGKTVNGEEIGPCIDADCGHNDCNQTRAMNATECMTCGKPIGYETRFFEIDGEMEHESCFVERMASDKRPVCAECSRMCGCHENTADWKQGPNGLWCPECVYHISMP